MYCQIPESITDFMNTKLSFLLIQFSFCLVLKVSGQSSSENFIIPDSLKAKSFEYLAQGYRSNTSDSAKANIYTNSCIYKAKSLKDTSKIISSLLLRGNYYYTIRDFSAALDYHIQGYDLAKNVKDDVYLSRINHNIGTLRVRSGEYRKALTSFKETYSYYQKDPELKTVQSNNYHKILFSIANSFRRLKFPDSAFYYTKIGIDNLKERDLNYYNYLLTEAILKLEFEKNVSKDLNKKFDSIIQFYSKNKKRTDPNIAFAHFYKGKLLLNQNDTISAIHNFKKVDSLFKTQKDIHPELRPTYEYLINYNKRTGDIKNELKYVKTLLVVDSTLNQNYRHLDTKIYKEYETPRLISEKNNLINKMKRKGYVSTMIIVSLAIILSISILFVFINYRKRKIYHKRYQNLVEQQKKSVVIEKLHITDNENTKETIDDVLSIIPNEIVQKVNYELDKFVKKEKFKESNLSSSIMANDFGTNTKYLSLIIKSKTGKTFTQFLNDLRIDYALKRIQNDSTFRKFTIQAIANECGFNTAEVFSKNFYKKTGIYPSYFIKKLQENE